MHSITPVSKCLRLLDRNVSQKGMAALTSYFFSFFLIIPLLLFGSSSLSLHNPSCNTCGLCQAKLYKFRFNLRRCKVSSGHLLNSGAFYCVQWLLADSDDSDQPARMRRLIWAIAVRICPKTISQAAPHITYMTVYWKYLRLKNKPTRVYYRTNIYAFSFYRIWTNSFRCDVWYGSTLFGQTCLTG